MIVQLVTEIIREKRDAIKDQVRKALTDEKIVDAYTNTLTESFDREWDLQVSFANKRMD